MSGPPTHHTPTQPSQPNQMFDLELFAESSYAQQHPHQHSHPHAHQHQQHSHSHSHPHPHDLTPTEPLLNSEENGYLSSFYQNVQQQGALLSGQNMPSDDIGWLMSEPAPNVQSVLLTTDSNHQLPHTPVSAYPHPRQSQHNFLHQQHFSPSAGIDPIHTERALSASNLDAAPSLRQQQQQQSQQHHQSIPHVPRLDTNPSRLSLTTNPQSIYIAPQSAPPIGRSNPRLYHFGSDQSFAQNGFMPAFEAERHEVREEQLTSELKRLIPINRTPRHSRQVTPEAVSSSRKRRMDDDSGPSTDDFSDVKRMRRNMSADATTLHIGSPKVDSRPTMRGRRGSLRGRGAAGRRMASPPETPTTPNSRKRENLNEEQKRQNHIASEQKRRNAIKNGFDTLTVLVPGCQEQIPKSAVLVEAANFLDRLVACNKEAQARIDAATEANGRSN